MELQCLEFGWEHLAKVQAFQCGTEPWAELAADWIKEVPPFPCALQSMQKYQTSVWLHILHVPALDEEYVVGFSSLGVARWSIPPPDGEKRDVGLIPMLAVATAFQGKPSGQSVRRYSEQIMDHLVAEASGHGYRELCLKVHADNARAIHFYQRFGFAVLGDKDGRGNLGMFKPLG